MRTCSSALQGLLSSLGVNADGNLTSEQVDRLSERLEQILGNNNTTDGDAARSSTEVSAKRNENGQVRFCYTL